MNTIKPMNLNDFCAAHAFDIPSFEDDRSETWLILTTKLSEALELPDDDEISDLLSSEAYRTEMPANGESQSDARHFISERGLYCLIFTSTAPTFKTFRDWALHVVLPIALEDAFYTTGEEKVFMPPPHPDLTNGVPLEDLVWLTHEVLPEIRRDGCYASISHLLKLKRRFEQGDEMEVVQQFLWDLKGTRSRKRQPRR